jgi:hypothetical protein
MGKGWERFPHKVVALLGFAIELNHKGVHGRIVMAISIGGEWHKLNHLDNDLQTIKEHGSKQLL